MYELLNLDIWEQIMLRLDNKSIFNLAQTCHSLYNVYQSPTIGKYIEDNNYETLINNFDWNKCVKISANSNDEHTLEKLLIDNDFASHRKFYILGILGIDNWIYNEQFMSYKNQNFLTYQILLLQFIYGCIYSKKPYLAIEHLKILPKHVIENKRIEILILAAKTANWDTFEPVYNFYNKDLTIIQNNTIHDIRMDLGFAIHKGLKTYENTSTIGQELNKFIINSVISDSNIILPQIQLGNYSCLQLLNINNVDIKYLLPIAFKSQNIQIVNKIMNFYDIKKFSFDFVIKSIKSRTTIEYIRFLLYHYIKCEQMNQNHYIMIYRRIAKKNPSLFKHFDINAFNKQELYNIISTYVSEGNIEYFKNYILRRDIGNRCLEIIYRYYGDFIWISIVKSQFRIFEILLDIIKNTETIKKYGLSKKYMLCMLEKSVKNLISKSAFEEYNKYLIRKVRNFIPLFCNDYSNLSIINMNDIINMSKT